MRQWPVSSRAHAATGSVGFCVTVSCILGAPRAPAFIMPTERKETMPHSIRECAEKQVAKMARVNALRRKLKIVDQSQRSGYPIKNQAWE